jgi:hypothetical protein
MAGATSAIRAGQIFAQGSRDKDEVLTADLDLDMIAEVGRLAVLPRSPARYVWRTGEGITHDQRRNHSRQ